MSTELAQPAAQSTEEPLAHTPAETPALPPSPPTGSDDIFDTDSNNNLPGRPTLDGLVANLQSDANWSTGERREVSVLFANIQGFQSTGQKLDSEKVYLITNEAMRMLAQIVHQFEGTVDKFTGSGLMALFGAPATHENDPERAVQAGLAMLDGLKSLQDRYEESLSLDFKAQIGINTGLVIAGNLGSDLHMEYTVIGDTVNMAARIQGIAAVGTVLVSQTTFQRTRGFFDFRSLPPVRVKGKPDPILAYQPKGRRTVQIQARGLAGLHVPMVGRQKMLEALVQAWHTVGENKEGQTALITGDAGLGKSRLVAEVRHRIGSNAQFFQANCLNHTRSTPFWLLGALLRDMLEIGEGDPPQIVQDRIVQKLQEMKLQAAMLAPYILNILGVEQPNADLRVRLAMMDAAMLQQQTHVAMHQVIRAEARQHPFVLILEDIHWIDSASRNFLIELLRSAGELPVLIILVSRVYGEDDSLRTVLSTLEKNNQSHMDLRLQALSSDQEYTLIEQLLSQADIQIPTIQHHIARRAEGNPFYIEELVRMLLEKLLEQPTPADQTEILPVPLWDPLKVEALMERVPPSLSGLILARYDSLGESLRRTMQLAAVIGRSFSFSLFQQLVQIDVEKLLEMFDELVDRQFLAEEPVGSEIGFSFRHVLVQEAVYSTMLHKSRRQLHGIVATVIRDSDFFPNDERAESLAYHYSHSEEPEQAIHYFVTAAQNANRRSAYESSLQFYRRALALCPPNPTPFSQDYGQIHIGLGAGLKFSGEFEEAQQLLLHGFVYLQQTNEQATSQPNENLPLLLENLRELADVCQRAGNFAAADRYVKNALDLAEPLVDSPLWYTLIERSAWIQFRLGELEQCAQLAREAIRHLEERPADQPFTLASFYNTMGGVAWQQSNLSEAITYVEGSLKIYEMHGLAWGVSVACANLGVLYWTLGKWAAGTEWYERAAKIQEENGFSFEHATSLRNLGYLRLVQGDTDLAHQDFERSLVLCLQHGHSFGALTTNLALAAWAVVLGDGKELSRHLEAAQAYKDSADTESSILLCMLTAQDFAYQGDFESALGYGHRALEAATEGGMQTELVEANHTIGVIFRKAGEFEKAEQHLMTAQRLAEERNAPDRVAHSQLELALLYEQMIDASATDAKQKWRQAALELVRAAIATYGTLGARLMLERSRNLEGSLLYDSIADESWHLSANAQETASDVRDLLAPDRNHIPGASHLPNGEKAHVTILWLLIELSNQGDEEDAFGQTAVLLNRISQIINQSGGLVIRHPAGIAATFGAPIAHEDDPARALQCATQIASFLAELRAQGTGTPLYRMGLDHGEVVVGYLTPQNNLPVITGEPMVRAEWLAQKATDGSIWLFQNLTKLLKKTYAFRQVETVFGPRGEGDQVAELISTLTATENQADNQERVRLIGRQPDLALLIEQAELLNQHKEGGFVWVEGEAGIGKSRLLAEFCDRLRDASHAIWRGNCSSQNRQQPFLLFSTLLNEIFGLAGIGRGQEQRERVQKCLSKWVANSSELQPYLELLCGIAPAPHDSQRLVNLEPEALHRQIFVAVRSLLVGIAQKRPLILVLDDLHLIDPMSADLLTFLSQMTASLPVLFVLAQRPIDNETIQKRLNAIHVLFEGKSRRIGLKRLSDQESRLLLNDLLPSGNLSPEAYHFILKRGDGNPYYLGEFLQLLIEQGHLQRESNVWISRSETALNDLPLPVTLEALIRSRVDGLPTLQRQILQMAAVIGRPFALPFLSNMMSTPLDAAVQELARRNLLAFRTDSKVWHFHHPIAQIVVYNGMLRVRLKALHGQVAAALLEEWGDKADEHAEELAHHLLLAEKNEGALHYLLLAGRRAEARYANEEALTYYEQAKALLRAMLGVVADDIQWQVAVGLGDAYRFAGNYDLSIEALEEGMALLQSHRLVTWRKAGILRRLGQSYALRGNPDVAYQHFHQALAMLADPTDRAGQVETSRTLYYLAYTHFRRGQWEKAKESCELGYTYAERSRDLSELAAAENLRGGIAYQQGQRGQAMYHTENALRLREQAGYTWGVASTMANLAILASENGDWVHARRHFLRSLRLRQELGDTEGVAIVNNNLGWLSRIKGFLGEAQAYFHESLRVAEMFKMVYHAANAMLGIGHILQLMDQIDEAQQMIDTSMECAEQIGAQGLLSEIYRVKADILLSKDAPEKAEESAYRAAVLAAETNSHSLEAEAWRVISECQIRQGELHKALESINRASQTLPSANDSIEHGRVASQAGRVLHSAGRTEEATIKFDEAESILRRLSADYDLALLARLRLSSAGLGSGATG